MTPEREKEIRQMLHNNTYGYLSTSVTELLEEIDRLREELTVAKEAFEFFY